MTFHVPLALRILIPVILVAFPAVVWVLIVTGDDVEDRHDWKPEPETREDDDDQRAA